MRDARQAVTSKKMCATSKKKANGFTVRLVVIRGCASMNAAKNQYR
jgi:hypothetical protein